MKRTGTARYAVCLPIDLPDARLPDQQSLRQKWDARVRSWEAAAGTRNMTVAFELWGQSELLTRLALEKHAGRCWFWFRQLELSPAWFASHLKEAAAAAGPRYTPELNVRLPITLLWLLIGEKLILNGSNRLAEEERPVIEVFRQAYTLTGDRVERVLRTACQLGGTPEEY